MSEFRGSVLTIDVGTSSLKAVLYSRDAGVLGSSSQRYGYRMEHAGWAEGDPHAWWAAFRDALQDLRRRGYDLGQAVAIAFTGQMHSAVLLNGEGRVIPPTILWLDRRADEETAELQRELRLPPYQLNSTYTLPKLLWLRRHLPRTLDQVRTILWPKDYLRYCLTGVLCTDLTEAGGAALLDWGTRQWAIERLERVGLRPEVLPEIRPAAGDGGALLPQAAADLGLNPHTSVVVGMGDVAALFGGAPPKPGRVTCSLGSSSMVFSALPVGKEPRDPHGRLYVYPFGPYPMLGGVSSTTGACLVWVYEKILGGTGSGLSFEQCMEGALEVPAGAEGAVFIPYLAGERSPYWSDDIRGGFYGLQLGHDSRHLVRAVLEGVAFSLRHLLDVYEELGVCISEIALAAGGTLTPGWPGIIADACQRVVQVHAGEETVTRVLYALCQAHLGKGRFEDSLAATFGPPAVYHPDASQAGVYSSNYRRYRAFSRFSLEESQHRRST